MKSPIPSSLPWDGSYLGRFEPECILREIESGKKRLVLLHIGYRGYYCLLFRAVSASRAAFRCMIDEMKEIFGLRKWGTHRIHIGRTLYFARRVPVDIWGFPCPEFRLLDVKVSSPLIVREIQRCFLFREILSLSCTNQANVVLSQENDWVARSTGETTTTFQRRTRDVSILSDGIIHTWFPNDEVEEIALTLLQRSRSSLFLRSRTERNLCSLIEDIRMELERTIIRLDREWIWYSAYILDRLVRLVAGKSEQ